MTGRAWMTTFQQRLRARPAAPGVDRPAPTPTSARVAAPTRCSWASTRTEQSRSPGCRRPDPDGRRAGVGPADDRADPAGGRPGCPAAEATALLHSATGQRSGGRRGGSQRVAGARRAMSVVCPRRRSARGRRRHRAGGRRRWGLCTSRPAGTSRPPTSAAATSIATSDGRGPRRGAGRRRGLAPHVRSGPPVRASLPISWCSPTRWSPTRCWPGAVRASGSAPGGPAARRASASSGRWCCPAGPPACGCLDLHRAALRPRAGRCRRPARRPGRFRQPGLRRGHGRARRRAGSPPGAGRAARAADARRHHWSSTSAPASSRRRRWPARSRLPLPGGRGVPDRSDQSCACDAGTGHNPSVTDIPRRSVQRTAKLASLPLGVAGPSRRRLGRSA